MKIRINTHFASFNTLWTAKQDDTKKKQKRHILIFVSIFSATAVRLAYVHEFSAKLEQYSNRLKR